MDNREYINIRTTSKDGIKTSLSVEKISNGYLLITESYGDVRNEIGDKKWFSETKKEYVKVLPKELKSSVNLAKSKTPKMLADKFE